MDIEEIGARMEIYDVLNRYVRGVDRRDSELLQSAYFADAVDIRSYSPDELSPAQFAARVVQGFGEVPEMAQHHMTNVHYDIDLDRGVADIESYAICFHPVGPGTSLLLQPSDGETHVRFVGTRYVDRFERRDGEWRIARRVALIDWARSDLFGEPAPVLSEWREDLRPGYRGDDPSVLLSRSTQDVDGTTAQIDEKSQNVRHSR